MSGTALLLGIDTGGTFTDAVLVAAERSDGGDGVVASAKAATTRDDLSLGIERAMARVLNGVDPALVSLVSISTTLATNALVEGRGGRVCLVAVGFSESELAAAAGTLGNDPLIMLEGGHNSHGEALAELDLVALDHALDGLDLRSLTGFAVVGQFAVRNPSHELAVAEHLRTIGLPITCSHELTAKLNGPKRAVTSILNARLIALITDLIQSTRRVVAALEIDAPIMVVRGDGSLISADMAAERPVETILSGPAASVVGARYLSGVGHGIVSDIGGTTTDVAIIEGGEPRRSPAGARVGPHTTMVEAVEIRTVGLGGDSSVWVDDAGATTVIALGPRRVVPVSALAHRHGDLVRDTLQRQLTEGPRWLSGQFAMLVGEPTPQRSAGIADQLIDALSDGPKPLRAICSTNRHDAVFDQLVDEGVAQRVAFTPTDACHVLGLQDSFDSEVATSAAELFAQRTDRRGRRVAGSAQELAESVVAAVVRGSADALLAAAFERDGLGPCDERAEVVQRALDRRAGVVHVSVALGMPLLPVGAPAATYYPAVAERLRTTCVSVPFAEVANAVGAVVGWVRMQATGTITRTKKGRFHAHAGESTIGFDDLEAAANHVDAVLRLQVTDAANRAGADHVDVVVERQDNVVGAEGERVFVGSTITAVARGRPRLG